MNLHGQHVRDFGRWGFVRTVDTTDCSERMRFPTVYHWHRVRVPWIVWAMLS